MLVETGFFDVRSVGVTDLPLKDHHLSLIVLVLVLVIPNRARPPSRLELY